MPGARTRAWVEVDLDALCANAEHVRRTAGPEAKLLPMVKADAYGLGMLPVARALADAFPGPGLAGFGVAAVAEGEALRAGGWPGRIVVFSPVAPIEFERAARADLCLCFSDVEALGFYAEVAARLGRRPAVHVEIDTGMGRAGLAWRDAEAWGPEVLRRTGTHLRWEGIFTHFHSADEPDLAPAEEQWRRFRAARAVLPPVPPGEEPRIVHVANSAAALRLPFRCDWVRPGIFLYGGRVGAEPPLQVASLRARVTLIREVPPGTSLGYGATYSAHRAELWGTLGIGYGDGLRRALGPAGGEALVRGRRVPLIGRISMDMTVVDLTDVPDARVGDVATLIGSDGEEIISLDRVAEQLGTISYEVLTGLTPRLPRLYTDSAADPVSDPARPDMER
jgi:alanine racemase